MPKGASLVLAGAALVAALLPSPRARADAYQDRRTETGLRLFRSLLAADLALEKKAGPDGRLLVLFFHERDPRRAEHLARAFARADAAGNPEPVRGLPLAIETTSDPAFRGQANRTPAGIFLAEDPSGANLRSIIQYGIANRVIVYSPFEGHVERGVLGGLAVEAQVRPYINQSTLAASNITLKDFFLKVTKVYQ